MIDSSKLTAEIEKQISLAVEKCVADSFDNNKNQPQINNIIQRSVEKTTKELLVNNKSKFQEIILDNIKNNSEITNSILEQSLPEINENAEKQYTSILENKLTSELSSVDWQERIKTTINQIVSRFSSELISSIDANQIIADTIREAIGLNDQQLKTVFSGIDDNTKGTKELVVMPDYVVVENTLASSNIKNIGNLETESISVKDLSVTGSINIDNKSWQTLADNISEKTFEQVDERFKSETVDRVLETASNSGIQFENIRVGNQLLVDGKRLSNYITETNIEKTGTLKSLDVTGNANFHDTLHVVNGRIGVNTDTPDMSLNIWDEEVSISVGKISSDRAFIGSNRKHELALGVNRQGDIVIDSDGTTTIKSLRVGRNSISHADQVPGWSGTKGDFVINTSPGKDQVFAWICLGDYRWKTLKSV